MIRVAARAVACGALAAFVGAALLALLYGIDPSLTIEFDRELPRIIGGMHAPERDDASGLTFAWSGREAVLRLRGLDRRAEWHLSTRLRGARVDPTQNPGLEFYVDGTLIDTRQSSTDFEQIEVPIPARPERRGAVITMRASRVFNPGPTDPRELGFMFDRIELTPVSVVFPPQPALGAIAVAAGAIGAALALVGLGLAASVGGAVAIAAAASLTMAYGFAPYSQFPSTAVTLALWVSGLTVIVARTIEWRSGKPLRNTARFAIAFSACAAFLKLLVLLHPNMPIGDALFHAHRFRTVADGNLFFTSIAPGGYQFPYAPGLYVAAAPFADIVTRNSGDMTLLRIFVIATDALAGGLLYLMIVRSWGDRLAAAGAVVLYHLTPGSFAVARTGNLTNAFAQSLAVIGLVMIADPGMRLNRRGYIAVLSGLLAAAFMSHTSTFAISFPACVLIAGMFLWKGGPALRSPAAAILLAAIVAAGAAVALYYAHFGETYRAEFARISAETASNAPDAGGRTTLERLANVPRYVRLYFDVPLVLLGGIGVWRLYVRGARDRATLATSGWIAACALFFTIGILTPVDMRYYLAAIPAVAFAGGAAASWLWTSGGLHRAAAMALLAWAATAGARVIFTF